MAASKILLVDDEERIRDMIKEYNALEEFNFEEAGDGRTALNLFKEGQHDLVILDVMMPQMDGWSVCREIRKTSQVPIVMLTARGEEYDKLFGFELGVDDYLVKPFSPKELFARIKAILRRSAAAQPKPANDSLFVIEGLKLDFAARNVYVDGEMIKLTPKEYELLHFFVQHKNQVFSRGQLLNGVWGYDFIGDDRTVDTHVKMLRESLRDYRRFIVTVWGTGYKFEAGGKS